jgi:predicted transcriptional regulator
MKTAISIPDELFHQIDLCSRRLKVSRSRLLADAARQYLAQQRAPLDATAAWNEVIAKGGQPGDDRAALALRRRSKLTLRAALPKRR